MLLQNPQLAYALLQAQIVMKIVEPQVALVSHFLFNFFSISPSQPTNTDTSLLRLIIKWGLQFSQSSKSIQTLLRRPCLSFYAMSRCCGLMGGGLISCFCQTLTVNLIHPSSPNEICPINVFSTLCGLQRHIENWLLYSHKS